MFVCRPVPNDDVVSFLVFSLPHTQRKISFGEWLKYRKEQERVCLWDKNNLFHDSYVYRLRLSWLKSTLKLHISVGGVSIFWDLFCLAQYMVMNFSLNQTIQLNECLEEKSMSSVMTARNFRQYVCQKLFSVWRRSKNFLTKYIATFWVSKIFSKIKAIWRTSKMLKWYV